MAGIQARFRLGKPDFCLNVDLDLPGTGVTAIFGHSGSGKTTLLRCIAGLEYAPAGMLAINGTIWQEQGQWVPTHKRPLGFVFQEPSLFSHLSVMGNLRYGLRRVSGTGQISLQHAIELLDIGSLADRKPDRLSGGERQRVSIARALATSPQLLLMDEPLAALDVDRKKEILYYLDRMQSELKIPVLYVSHAPDEVVRLADHIVVLDRGRAIAAGPLAEMLTMFNSPLRLGSDAGAVVAVTIGAVDREWHLTRADFAGGSLWLPDYGPPVGHQTRVRILARDVSVAHTFPEDSSIQNVFRGSVNAIGNDEHPGLMLVRIQVGNTMLLSKMTKRDAAMLEFSVGQTVWAQVKSAALL